MHEYSICQALVDVITAEMDKVEAPRPLRLIKARVVIGGMRQLVPDILQTAYEVMTRDTPAKGSTLEIVNIPAAATCKECGWTGEIEDVFFQCGSCGSTAVELTKGMELYLDKLEIQSDE